MPHTEIPLDELQEGSPVRVEHEGFGIVVVRRGGAIHAFEDFCPHAGWRLSDGETTPDHIECPGHGWKFDLGTGRCLDVPFYCLRRITVTTVDGMARLSWEAPAGEGDGATAP
jgi:nitrite reductase/ring-hydroxylating ferredoxin subunit